MSTWHLGPLGDLRSLPVPERGITTTVVRYGGVHQGLSGARTIDVTGHRGEYAFQWRYLDQADWGWLEALHTRQVPGPLRLLNPLRRNRLSTQAASLIPDSSGTAGINLVGLWNWEWDWPDWAGIGRRSLRWSSYPPGAVLRTDVRRPAAVMPGETVTCSVAVRAEGDTTAEFGIDFYTRLGRSMPSPPRRQVLLSTVWQHVTVTATVPQLCAGVGFAVHAPAPVQPLRLAACQIEASDQAGQWQQGGGAPMVLVDQLTSSSPRYPFMDCSMTLLEA